MQLPVILTPEADSDILDMTLYLMQQSQEVCKRFYAGIDHSLEQLSNMPELGEIVTFKRRKFPNVRRWAVKGFPNHLIFYKIESNEIHILRLLHSSTNYKVNFSIEK